MTMMAKEGSTITCDTHNRYGQETNSTDNERFEGHLAQPSLPKVWTSRFETRRAVHAQVVWGVMKSDVERRKRP